MPSSAEMMLMVDDSSSDPDVAATETSDSTFARTVTLPTDPLCAAAKPKTLRRHRVLGVLVAMAMVGALAAVFTRRVLAGAGSLATQLDADAVEQKAGTGCGTAFAQCGGVGFTGAKCCAGSCTCSHDPNGGNYYQQCEPPAGQQACDGPGQAPPEVETPPPPTAAVSHCSEILKDCHTTRCCNAPDLKCYEKDATWAMCNVSCTKGPDPIDGKPWNCKDLTSKPSTKVFARRVENCGWTWEKCSDSNCCKIPGMGCFGKNADFAVCMQRCSPGKDPREPANSEPWQCIKRAQPELTYMVNIDMSVQPGGTSLFCFSAILKHSYEELLLAVQKKRKLGIFGCDESNVLQKAQDGKGGRQAMKDFTEIWMEIKGGGQFARNDWTVKVDPDAVFIPQRLRTNLDKWAIPAGTAIYLKKNPFWTGGDMLNIGAIYVFSKEVLHVYFKNWWSCKGKLHDFGEDFYMRTCMDAYGVRHIVDESLLNDLYSLGNKWEPVNKYRCSNQRFVAFHPYQNVTSWIDCHAVAMGKESTLGPDADDSDGEGPDAGDSEEDKEDEDDGEDDDE